jgi:hypothetical protein
MQDLLNPFQSRPHPYLWLAGTSGCMESVAATLWREEARGAHPPCAGFSLCGLCRSPILATRHLTRRGLASQFLRFLSILILTAGKYL